jgi:predicted amidohydrolase YtcJ
MDDDASPVMNGESDATEEPGRGLSRRQFLGSGAGAAAGVAAGVLGPSGIAAAATGANQPGEAINDIVLIVNGRIHTMDANGSVIENIAVNNGRFIPYSPSLRRGRGTQVINLRGRVAVPGIIDNHNHIVLMGNRPGFHTPLENAYSVAEVGQTFAARAAGVPAGSWITTIGGFHVNHFAERRLPTRAELDLSVPDHPAYISQGFSGPSTTNTLGKAAFEALSPPIAVGEDGSIAPGSEQTGRATLFLRRTLLDSETRQRGALDAMAYGASLGVTTHLDQGAFQKTDTPSDGAAHEDNYTMHLPFLELYADGLIGTRLRINFLHMESDPATPGLLERLRNAFPFFGGDMVKTGGIGEFIAQGTAPTSPFLDAARRVARARWRAEVHSLSRTDFQQEIQAFEVANQEFGITDLRWVVAHVPFITEDYVNRHKALGGGLSLTSWRYLAGTATNNGPPFRMIVDNGIPAGMSSDGMQIAPMNPWIHMYYATTGKNALGQLINGGQQITRDEVLRLYTGDNGWFLREEDDIGSIEPGKFADLVVLDRDYFTVPEEELKQIRSVLTIVGGQVVHDAGVVR